MSEEIKLKPCPFCGNEPEMYEHKSYDEFEDKLDISFSVDCPSCQYWWVPSSSKSAAILAWNTRHGDSNE